MTTWKTVALVVIIVSAIIGAVYGVLLSDVSPPLQKYDFTGQGVITSNPVSCGNIPRNYSEWLEINVNGNRTGMNFQRVTIYGNGNGFTLGVPLNQTAFVHYNPVNLTLEIITVPLPDYWGIGDSIVVSIAYFISGYSPTSSFLPSISLLSGTLQC